jgi:hypothetical protein
LAFLLTRVNDGVCQTRKSVAEGLLAHAPEIIGYKVALATVFASSREKLTGFAL